MEERMNSMDRELIEATRGNNLPEGSRLLRAGADVNVNATDSRDMTPLHEASQNGYLPIVNELLVHGAAIDAKDNDGWTPLHFACCYGHVAVGNELLSRGANIYTKDYDGNTPLHDASVRGHLPVVKALLSGGAKILAANNYGKLPIHLAVNRGHSAVTKCLLQHLYATTRRLPLHELLEDLAWMSSPNSGPFDVPPLHLALDRNVLGTDDVVNILEYLVERNPALVSSRDQDGSLPLHVACRRGASFAIVQSLANCFKASVKSVTSEGDLPHFLACEMSKTSLDTIFLLMKLYPELVYR
jgi:ankyrin repeat protein